MMIMMMVLEASAANNLTQLLEIHIHKHGITNLSFETS